jgi:hypothetical protein
MVDATTRIVPGAPPPTPVSKSQKKKRKAVKGKLGSAEPDNPIIPDTTTASVSDQKPEVSDEKEATVPPNHVVAPSASEAPPSATEDDIGYKPSPVVDLVHKRLKAIHKKIVSIVWLLSPLSSWSDWVFFGAGADINVRVNTFRKLERWPKAHTENSSLAGSCPEGTGRSEKGHRSMYYNLFTAKGSQLTEKNRCMNRSKSKNWLWNASRLNKLKSRDYEMLLLLLT